METERAHAPVILITVAAMLVIFVPFLVRTVEREFFCPRCPTYGGVQVTTWSTTTSSVYDRFGSRGRESRVTQRGSLWRGSPTLDGCVGIFFPPLWLSLLTGLGALFLTAVVVARARTVTDIVVAGIETEGFSPATFHEGEGRRIVLDVEGRTVLHLASDGLLCFIGAVWGWRPRRGDGLWLLNVAGQDRDGPYRSGAEADGVAADDVIYAVQPGVTVERMRRALFARFLTDGLARKLLLAAGAVLVALLVWMFLQHPWTSEVNCCLF